MHLFEWRGKGFPFRDGRACVGFRVFASTEEDAKKLLNSVAGWRWFTEEPLKECKGKKAGSRRVVIRWQAGGPMVEVEIPKRQGRLPEAAPSGATLRVQKSVQKLVDSGGHRSTVRWGKEAWDELQILMVEFGLNQSDTLEKLILDRSAEMKGKVGS